MSSPLGLAARIAQAKERAESFVSRNTGSQKASSVNDSMMSPVDKERQRWAQLYQEKSVIIEQLERELGTTVDALHASQQSPNSSTTTKEYSTTTNIDLLNLTDALRKENESLKISITSLLSKKNQLETESIEYKNENMSLKRDKDGIGRQLSHASETWEAQEAYFNSTISSLESHVVSLKAELKDLSGCNKSQSHYQLSTNLVDTSSSREDTSHILTERNTYKKLLEASHDEITWLRDMIEYVRTTCSTSQCTHTTTLITRSKLQIQLPPFSVQDASSTFVLGDESRREQQPVIMTSSPAVEVSMVSPVVRREEAVAVDGDAISSINANNSSFDDMERMIAKAQETKVRNIFRA
jgi:hypothetical protein